MGSRSAAGLVGAPVRLHGIMLGRALDLVLDGAGRRMLGFVVESGDDAPRFLPYAAAQPGADVIAVASALMLLDDLSFYRKHGLSLRSLLGTAIERENVPVGTLIDMHIDESGAVVELEVELAGVRDRVPAAGASVAAAATAAA